MTITTTTLLTKIMLIMLCMTLVLSIIIMFGGSNIFKKASKGDKSANKPILNLFVMLDVVDMSAFYGILFFVPFLNMIVISMMSYKLGKVFNTGIGYQIGLVLFPFAFYPMLAFSDKQYKVSDEEYFKLMDNAKDLSIQLMTQEDIKEANNQVVEEESVDSVFKTQVQVIEKVEPYKATRVNILDTQENKDEFIIEEYNETQTDVKSDEDIEMVDL